MLNFVRKLGVAAARKNLLLGLADLQRALNEGNYVKAMAEVRMLHEAGLVIMANVLILEGGRGDEGELFALAILQNNAKYQKEWEAMQAVECFLNRLNRGQV